MLKVIYIIKHKIGKMLMKSYGKHLKLINKDTINLKYNYKMHKIQSNSFNKSKKFSKIQNNKIP